MARRRFLDSPTCPTRSNSSARPAPPLSRSLPRKTPPLRCAANEWYPGSVQRIGGGDPRAGPLRQPLTTFLWANKRDAHLDEGHEPGAHRPHVLGHRARDRGLGGPQAAQGGQIASVQRGIEHSDGRGLREAGHPHRRRQHAGVRAERQGGVQVRVGMQGDCAAMTRAPGGSTGSAKQSRSRTEAPLATLRRSPRVPGPSGVPHVAPRHAKWARRRPAGRGTAPLRPRRASRAG